MVGAASLLLLLACAEKAEDSATPGVTEGAPEAEAGDDLVSYVGEAVRFDGSASSGAESYTWTPGDGGAGEGEAYEHTYAAPGHYIAYLEVTGPDGQADTDSLRVTVVHPPLAAPPAAASAVVGQGGRVFVAMPDYDRVAVVDAETGALTGHLETCAGPRSLAADAALLVVACPGADALALFDVVSLAPVGEASFDWGARPFAAVLDADGIYAVLQGTGEVAGLTRDGALSWTAPVGPDPRGLAVSDGALLVSRHRGPDEGGQWWRVELSTRGVEGFLLAPSPGPDSDTDARGVPGYLTRIAVRPDGRAAVFPGLKANLARGEARDGLALTSETSVRAVLRQVSLDPDEGAVGGELAYPLFDNRDFAAAAAYSPLGDWVYVAHPGAEVIDVLDAVTLQRGGGFQNVGAGLDGLWASPDGELLWAHLEGARALVAFEVSDLSAPPSARYEVDLRGELAEPLSDEVLAGKILFQRSVDPRMSRDGYISCASCHLDGDHDGRTWDFTDRGEGLRNTIGLLGRGGTGHGPVHWSANFDEIQDFENDIRNAFGGTGFLSDEDWAATSDTLGASKAGLSAELDALSAYVESLETVHRSPWRAVDGALGEAAARGEALFLAAETGCADCHPAPEYTDSQWLNSGEPLLHDVGTITADSGGRMGGVLPGVDTPTLRGLFDSAPYLHDGSAATLEEVLTSRNPDDAHGATRQLSDADLEDLIAFLLSIE